MITLAVMTGISAEQWAKEGARAIVTAFEELSEIRGLPARSESEEDGQDERR